MMSIQPKAFFRKDERGSVAVPFGLVAVTLMLFGGGAIDIGRWLFAKRVTAAAIDAAVLGGARALQLDPNNISGALTAAQSIYNSNIANRTQVDSDTITFAATESNTAITASGQAFMKTTFLNLAGISRLEITNAAGASFPTASIRVGGSSASNMELSIMLDVTGSMCDDGVGPCTTGTKISGLKDAANELINLVVASDQSKFTSKVALVPFSTRVRVGPDGGGGTMMKALTNLDPTWTGWYNVCDQSSGSGGSEGGGNWSCLHFTPTHMVNKPILPCVTDRFYDNGWVFDATEVAPGHSTWLNAHDGSRMTVSRDSSETAPTGNTGHTNVAADLAEHWNYDDGGYCADVAEGNQILPLTSDKSALANRIDGMEAYGSTAGALGTAWSWYMLSPNWSNIFAGNSRPAPYSDLTRLQASGAPVLRKVAILMTDGGYNTFRGWKDQDQQQVSDYATQVCTNMKARGIEVYTVGFALNELAAGERTIARATLQACGTDIQHFYETLTVPELKTAFREIGAKMTTLFLSK